MSSLRRSLDVSATYLRDQINGTEKLGPEVEAALWSTAKVALYRRLLEEAETELDAVHERGGLMSATLRVSSAAGALAQEVDEAMADGVVDEAERRGIAKRAEAVATAGGRAVREAESDPDANA